MPARKPKGLIQRHETKDQLQDRADREAAFGTGIDLPMGAPSELKENPIAAKTWRRLMKEFAAIQDSYVISLDRDMLVNYCILIEQRDELDELRAKAISLWRWLGKMHKKLVDQGLDVEALQIAQQVSSTFDRIVKLDARVDQKRKAIFDLQKSLYMTPRARAGAVPIKAPPEEEPDEMEKLLGDVKEYVNGNDG